MFAQETLFPGRTSAKSLASGAAEPWAGITQVLAGAAMQKAVAVLCDLLAITAAHTVSMRIVARLLRIAIDVQGPFQYHRYYIPYFALMLWIVGGYKSLQLRRPEQELEQGCKAVVAGFLGLVLFNFVVFRSAPFSRYSIVLWFFISTVLVLTLRFSLRAVYALLWKRGLCRRRALLVGPSIGISEYWQLLRIQRHFAYEYLGVLLDSRSLVQHPDSFLGLPVLGNISDWETELNVQGANLMIVAHQENPGDVDWVHKLICRCRQMHVDVELYSSVLATANLSHEHDEFSGCFQFYAKPNWALFGQRLLKRGMDIVIGFVGSVVTVILTPFIYLIVNLEQPGPLFYRSAYVGQDGTTRHYLKFRTMRVGADRILQNDPLLRARFREHQKLPDDPRVTKVGRILRKLSVDEFPQFFSVLKGDLTFVGPRTIRQEEAERYGARLARLLSVKPGLTGFWQVMGRQTTTYDERIQMDMFYLDRWSIWLDLVIIAKTFWKVIKAEGAY